MSNAHRDFARKWYGHTAASLEMTISDLTPYYNDEYYSFHKFEANFSLTVRDAAGKYLSCKDMADDPDECEDWEVAQEYAHDLMKLDIENIKVNF